MLSVSIYQAPTAIYMESVLIDIGVVFQAIDHVQKAAFWMRTDLVLSFSCDRNHSETEIVHCTMYPFIHRLSSAASNGAKQRCSVNNDWFTERSLASLVHQLHP